MKALMIRRAEFFFWLMVDIYALTCLVGALLGSDPA